MAGLSTSKRRTGSKAVGQQTPCLPPQWRSDSRPDPSVLGQEERLREFGRLMYRAIERKKTRFGNPKNIKDATT